MDDAAVNEMIPSVFEEALSAHFEAIPVPLSPDSSSSSSIGDAYSGIIDADSAAASYPAELSCLSPSNLEKLESIKRQRTLSFDSVFFDSDEPSSSSTSAFLGAHASRHHLHEDEHRRASVEASTSSSSPSSVREDHRYESAPKRARTCCDSVVSHPIVEVCTTHEGLHTGYYPAPEQDGRLLVNASDSYDDLGDLIRRSISGSGLLDCPGEIDSDTAVSVIRQL
mmetsp:Transcript_18356/g.36075  ORF Transcript_18356/g.36075 Transcript_18356/m.36075 type:complete len:225 (-) Transcript_18356:162-836(-)